jgi:hypothetical protein
MARFLATSLTAIVWVASAGAAPAADPLAEAFRDPPASARPRVWWHWLNGNITEEAITKDLEWMKRVGLGGVQTFDASLGTPQLVKNRLAYMTPAWKAAFAHATATANRLGLELAIASSPGWSETGGPWVTPADAMKKLVWSEIEIPGGRRFAGKLPDPPAGTGPYGTAPFLDPLASFGGQAGETKPRAYGPIKVLAYPIAPGVPALPSAVDQAGHALNAASLSDAREDTSVDIVRGTPAAPAAIVLSYDAPQTMRSATLFVPGAAPPFGDPEFLPILEARTAGGWTRLATLPLGNVPTTVSFAPVAATQFRIVFGPNTAPRRTSDAPPAPGAVVGGVFPSGPAREVISVGTFRLTPEAKVDRFEAKAGFSTVTDYYALSEGLAETASPAPGSVIDLTARMREDGTLDWTPPAGRWRIVRLGWSLLGTTNHPASPDTTGLEVDKYDGAAVGRYMTTYLDTYRAQLGSKGKGIDDLLTDSIESGDANWTPRMIEQFRSLRGYDPVPWLPALTGAVIGSRARSDAFLYDYRRTLADLIASQHYATIATIAHAKGLKLYGEALEDGRPQLGDDMAMRAHTDVPMAAMWAFGRDGEPRPTLMGDILGAASVAHVYGQNLVAAESFTAAFAPWAFAPSDLRRVADLEFALGVNRPVIHTSVHSPTEDKEPGLSLAIFGQYFNRHETWSEMARPWIDYLARSSLLLQQGRHVADIAYFYGEEAPLTALYAQAPIADTPADRGFDFVNADILADELAVRDGELIAKTGARYRLLYLGGSSQRMTVATLRRVAALADAGATIVGDAPVSSPGIDDPAEFRALVARLWSGAPETAVGKGRVIAGHDPASPFARIGLSPDFSYRGQAGTVMFQHRAVADGDIYFLNNRSKQSVAIDGRFRVTGKIPEIWHADNGSSERVSFRADGGGTIVPLTIAPETSLFVVFRQGTATRSSSVAMPRLRTIAEVAGPWNVTFQPGRGAPASIALQSLAPLDRQSEPGVRYFSGIATYTAHLTLPHVNGKGHMMLDLGKVGDVAEVRVNGELVGTAWKAPYRVDLGKAARPGDNLLEVRVANLWVNRLIGDAQPGATKTTYTVLPSYRADAPLRTSGLIGPVTILSVSLEK